MMSDDISHILAPHLVPGERLLWAGRPKQGFALRGWDILALPFSIFAVVFGVIVTIFELRAK
jgi:hypothetical protein